jgi:hypothetical protein
MVQRKISKPRQNRPSTRSISTRPKWDACIAVREATAGALQALGVMVSFVIFGLTFGLGWGLIAGASPYDGRNLIGHHATNHALDHERAGVGLVDNKWPSNRRVHSENHDSRAKTDPFRIQLASSDRGQR